MGRLERSFPVLARAQKRARKQHAADMAGAARMGSASVSETGDLP